MSFSQQAADAFVIQDALRVMRPPEAKASAADILAIWNEWQSMDGVPQFPIADIVRIFALACVQLAVSQTVDEADYTHYSFSFNGHQVALDPLVVAVHTREHPVDDSHRMTLRAFARVFAKPVYTYLKQRKDDRAFWPQLAVKYPTLCPGFEYCCFDFLNPASAFLSEDEREAIQRVREKALTEAEED